MKRSQDIEVLRLTAEVHSLQSQLAFYMEKVESSVSREEYEAEMAKRDAEIAEYAAKERLHADELALIEHRHAAEIVALKAAHKAELEARDLQLREYLEIQAMLRSENTDFKTMMQFWQSQHFGPSSEAMTAMMDRIVGKLPTNALGMAADILSLVERLNHSDWNPEDIKLPSPVAKDGKAAGETKDAKASAGGSTARNRKRPKCLDVREFLPADFSELPPGFKVIMRNGKPDEIVIEIIHIEKPKAYSKKYTVARCNVPGSDPMSSKYPPRLFGKVDADPSFAAFVLEMKYSYNMPESRILELLAKARCRIPQATLNKWMHQVIQGLQDTLMPGMLSEIKSSRVTHNDETRILVRSQEAEEDSPSYKTEYIHGILSPQANLFLMLYVLGSRSHKVQLDVFRDSDIIAFLADRCPLYTKLVELLDIPLIRGACWIHFRRYLLHAYMQDKRLEVMVHLLARLFAAERLISGMRDLTEERRLRERERMCRPLVEAMFTFMERVRDAGTEYGVLARRAADYLLNDREGFRAFLKCGLLEIGNNAVERCFKNIAKGRENWLQCGSHKAAEHTAFMYSLVESCRMNGLDFGLYIETVLRRIQDGDTDIHGMLPNVITLPNDALNASVA